jgi:hypothetical protein
MKKVTKIVCLFLFGAVLGGCGAIAHNVERQKSLSLPKPTGPFPTSNLEKFGGLAIPIAPSVNCISDRGHICEAIEK